jgi:hypothetical protein
MTFGTISVLLHLLEKEALISNFHYTQSLGNEGVEIKNPDQDSPYAVGCYNMQAQLIAPLNEEQLEKVHQGNLRLLVIIDRARDIIEQAEQLETEVKKHPHIS